MLLQSSALQIAARNRQQIYVVPGNNGNTGAAMPLFIGERHDFHGETLRVRPAKASFCRRAEQPHATTKILSQSPLFLVKSH
jgi:hypothetical protein